MTQSITLQLPDDLVSIAQAEAERSAKPLNVVLVQTANVQSTFCPFAAEEERMLYIDLND